MKHLVRQKKSPPPLSEVQLRIMQAVWDAGEAGVADVWKRLAAERPVARNTVQTLMKRLEDKGWLRHRAVGNTFLYSATIPRRRTLRRMVHSLLDAAFAGSTADLIAALLEERGISPQEAERIRRMIDDAREGKP